MFSRQGDGSLKPMDFEMPQRPEFFMGGGALFSTPRNYMAFLQMLLHEGTFNGAQVLKPETVALMRQNHIGDLNVITLKTVHPESSNDANLFPGTWIVGWAPAFPRDSADRVHAEIAKRYPG